MTKFHFYIVVTLLALILSSLNVGFFGFGWLGIALFSFICALIWAYKDAFEIY